MLVQSKQAPTALFMTKNNIRAQHSEVAQDKEDEDHGGGSQVD